jgi:hypothetical protein
MWEYNGTVLQLFIELKKAYDSIKREVLYNIVIEFGIPRKLVGLIKMCLNETYSFLKQGHAFITIAFQLCFGICNQGGPRESGRTKIEWDTSAFGLC